MSSWLFVPELTLSLLAVSKPGSKLPAGVEFWSKKNDSLYGAFFPALQF
jgi:hypothetical protein